MSTDPIHPSPCPPHLLLQDRCRVLGIPTWRFDASGDMLAAPGDAGYAGAWLRSAVVESRVREWVARWAGDAAPGRTMLDEEFWLIPLVESRRRKRTGYIVAAVFGPGLASTPFFRASCASAGLDEAAVADALARIAVFPASAVDRLAFCLSWSQSDLQALAADAAKIDSFSRQLAESYEEVTLLQKLGRSMNQAAHPQKFVALACDELQKTLPYDWVAVRFAGDRKAARSMAGRLYVSGSPPCPRLALEVETARHLATLGPHEARVLDASQRGPCGTGDSQLLVQPVTRDQQVVAAMFAGNKRGEDPQVSSTDIKLFEAAAASLSVLLDNAVLYDDQQSMFVGTLEALTSSIDAKDPYTCGHSQRVADLAASLAAAHGLPEDHVERVRLAGIVHDVGKIGVPEAVLCKTGRLTDDEFALIKQHPEIGFQILSDIPQFEDLLPGVLYHHERFDGKGYPRRLAGADIPLMARIIGLVDAFDAMSSNRTYRSAMPRERVFEELADHAGTQFDPALVQSFRAVDLARYDELVEKHQAENASGQGGLRIRRTGLAA